MLERSAIFGYLLVALTVAYYPHRRHSGAMEVEKGRARGRLPLFLAVPTLIGAPALVLALATDVRAGLLAALVSGVVAISLLGIDRWNGSGRFWGVVGGREASRPVALHIVSDLMVLVRFVFFGAVGGALLARWLGAQPGVLALLLVLTLGMMAIPDWPRSVEKVDWLHGILWCALALLVAGYAVVNLISGGKWGEIRAAVPGKELLWLAVLAVILSTWFWLDDSYVLSRLGSIPARRRTGAVATAVGAQVGVILAVTLAWPSVLRILGGMSFAEHPRSVSLLHRGVLAVASASAILSVMMGSLHAAVIRLSGSPWVARLPGTEGLRSRLLAAALIVAVLPGVEVASRFPTLASWAVVLAVVVLIPPAVAYRALLELLAGGRAELLRWVPVLGALIVLGLVVISRSKGVEKAPLAWSQIGVLGFVASVAIGGLLEWGSHLHRKGAGFPSRGTLEVGGGRSQERR